MISMAAAPRTHDDYTVGWICPLEVEQIAAVEMLDERHPRLHQPITDNNAYMLGSIQHHNVVIVGLPRPGNCSAATVVAHMRSTFPRLRFGLLVGIGGGVPVRTDKGPIRLGHVVVSKPTGQHSGAVQYDRGEAETGHFRRTGYIAPPPNDLLDAAQRMAVAHAGARADPLQIHLQRIDTSIRGLRRFRYPGLDRDHLYQSEYIHVDRNLSCRRCGCDAGKRVDRSAVNSEVEEDAVEYNGSWIKIHRGTVASGEKVIRNAKLRDQLAEENNVLCFEMEAAGALNEFPCLVIRGISDYSDSHKDDKWHGYAAAAAAAYARELFFHMPVDEVTQVKIPEIDFKQISDGVHSVARSRREAELRLWLTPPNPLVNYIRACKLYCTGTESWRLPSEHYARWKKRFARALWPQGTLGCGKKMLTSAVTKCLRFCLSNTLTVLSFYIDFVATSKQTLDNVLRSLMFQNLPLGARISKVC